MNFLLQVLDSEGSEVPDSTAGAMNAKDTTLTVLLCMLWARHPGCDIQKWDCPDQHEFMWPVPLKDCEKSTLYKYEDRYLWT